MSKMSNEFEQPGSILDSDPENWPPIWKRARELSLQKARDKMASGLAGEERIERMVAAVCVELAEKRNREECERLGRLALDSLRENRALEGEYSLRIEAARLYVTLKNVSLSRLRHLALSTVVAMSAGKRSALRCGLHAASEGTEGEVRETLLRMLADVAGDTIAASEDFLQMLPAPDVRRHRHVLCGETVIENPRRGRMKVHRLELHTKRKVHGREGELLSRFHAPIYSSEYPKSKGRSGTLPARMARARRMCFIGIMHPNLPGMLETLAETSEEGTLIEVYYAASELEDALRAPGAILSPAVKRRSLKRLKSWWQGHENRDRIGIRTYEYERFPAMGAALIDVDDAERGFLHVSPYLPGLSPEECPYVDLGPETGALFDFYLDYLRKNVIGQGRLLWEAP